MNEWSFKSVYLTEKNKLLCKRSLLSPTTHVRKNSLRKQLLICLWASEVQEIRFLRKGAPC